MSKTRLEAVLFDVAIVIVVVTGSIDQCPKGLTLDRYLQQHGNSCYEFVLNHHGDWFHAEQYCELHRGFLVHIQSAADQAFIYQALRDYNFHGDKGVWIGFTDVQVEGNWKWSSGDHVTFTYWSPGQPSVLAGGLEDCALLDFSDGGHWHDYACHGILFNTQNHGWICQYAASPKPTDMLTSSTAQTTVVSTNATDVTPISTDEHAVSTTLETTTSTTDMTTTPIAQSTDTTVIIATPMPPQRDSPTTVTEMRTTVITSITGMADTTIITTAMPDSTTVNVGTTS